MADEVCTKKKLQKLPGNPIRFINFYIVLCVCVCVIHNIFDHLILSFTYRLVFSN